MIARDRIKDLGGKLAPFIDAGEIESAKYWNGNPSAINVYSLERDRWNTRRILKDLGARHVLVWEYDYAWTKTCSLRLPLPIHDSPSSGRFSRAVASEGACNC